jgi:ubiquinone/menaquinone biosynthesis C-methylase UbiE
MRLRAFSTIGFLLVCASADAQTATHSHEAHRLHNDPDAYIAALENPARDAYQKPAEVVKVLGLKTGEIVADIGAGSGYFTLRVAREVGPKGHVYAVDVMPEMILHLNRRVRDAGLLNVSTILAPPDDPLIPRQVDRFLIVDVWHHIEDQAGYLAALKKLLKPGGQIVMIDFQKRELPVGPPVAMKIARDDLVAQMKEHGFVVTAEHTFLPYQYFLVFSASRTQRSAGDGRNENATHGESFGHLPAGEAVGTRTATVSEAVSR